MESIEQGVGDFTADELKVFEKVLGQKLQQNQRVVIQIIDVNAGQSEGTSLNQKASSSPAAEDELPTWVTIFADVPEDEMSELEALILDRSEGRPS